MNSYISQRHTVNVYLMTNLVYEYTYGQSSVYYISSSHSSERMKEKDICKVVSLRLLD